MMRWCRFIILPQLFLLLVLPFSSFFCAMNWHRNMWMHHKFSIVQYVVAFTEIEVNWSFISYFIECVDDTCDYRSEQVSLKNLNGFIRNLFIFFVHKSWLRNIIFVSKKKNCLHTYQAICTMKFVMRDIWCQNCHFIQMIIHVWALHFSGVGSHFCSKQK